MTYSLENFLANQSLYIKSADLTEELVKSFYDSNHCGILIIRDPSLTFLKPQISESQDFSLKDHQEINNGQIFCSNLGGFARHLSIYRQIRTKFTDKIGSHICHSLTRYPISERGAEYHLDFSYNINAVVTFFFGSTTFLVAKDKLGTEERSFQVYCGDIVIMRAPRDIQEKQLRPIHSVGKIEREILTLEIREINPILFQKK